MTKRALLMGTLTAFGAFAVLAFSATDSGVRANHLVGGADSIALDAVTTGNTATALAAQDNCVEATAGSSVDIDLTITNIPTTNPMIAFAARIWYDQDNSFLSISGVDGVSFLIGSKAGSLESQQTDDVPDLNGDGIFNVAAFDTGPVPGSSETGSGVLARITIDIAADANGAFPLHLTETSHVDTEGAGKPPLNYLSTQIAVGVTCASLPTVEAPPGKMGDVDCSNTVNAIDALKVLRFNAGLAVAQTQPCNRMGLLTPHVGDVDCSGTINAIDALKVLRFNAGLVVQQTEPCDDINT